MRRNIQMISQLYAKPSGHVQAIRPLVAPSGSAHRLSMIVRDQRTYIYIYIYTHALACTYCVTATLFLRSVQLVFVLYTLSWVATSIVRVA